MLTYLTWGLVLLGFIATQPCTVSGQNCSATAHPENGGLSYDPASNVLSIESALLATASSGPTTDSNTTATAWVLLDSTQPRSAAACAAHCSQLTGSSVNSTLQSQGVTGCNIWTWCGNGGGCCASAHGCTSPAQLQHALECTTAWQRDLGSAAAAQLHYIYTPADALAWNASPATYNASYAYTSGLVLNSTVTALGPDVADFGAYVGQDAPGQYDQSCIAPFIPSTTQCAKQGDTAKLAATCNSTTGCTGFTYDLLSALSGGPYGILKFGTVQPQCLIAAPTIAFYAKAAGTTAVSSAPAAGGSRGHLGAILGGVLGGVGGIVLLACVAGCAFVTWRRHKRRQSAQSASSASDPEAGQKAAADDSAHPGKALVSAPAGAPGDSAEEGGVRGAVVPDLPPEGGVLPLGRRSLFTDSARLLAAQAAPPAVPLQLPLSEIQVLKRPDGSDWLLGRGGYGAVYKAKYLAGNQIVAVKVLERWTSKALADPLVREASILAAIQHPNILRYLGWCSLPSGQTMLVTDFCELGDLRSALSLRPSEFSWYRRGRQVALEVAAAVLYLHTRPQKIVHYDLKAANVLITKDSRAKLADVGLAKVFRSSEYQPSGVRGTFEWCAPELLLGKQRVDERADIYSFGVLVWEIATCEVPQRGRMRPLEVPEDCPQALADLVERCCSPEPSKRPFAGELLELLTAVQ